MCAIAKIGGCTRLISKVYGIHLTVISMRLTKLLFYMMIFVLKLLPHLPGANELVNLETS